MALKGEIKKIPVGETEKEVFSLEFSNGTYEQLKELKNFLIEKGIALEKGKELESVIEVAIGFLERLKENKQP